MAGALMQLVAYGAQDVYLTSEPTITFWKAVYRRHTNFAMEAMNQTFSGSKAFGQTVTARISRNGDLMACSWITAVISLTAAPGAVGDTVVLCSRVGFALLKSVELRIGGQMIDRHFSTWMHIWTELSADETQKRLLDKLVGVKNPAATPAEIIGGVRNGQSIIGERLQSDNIVLVQVPLQFSFCRTPGLAIPLIALQYHEVEIVVEFEKATNLIQRGAGVDGPLDGSEFSLIAADLWVDYVFLDTDERKEFAQKPHEYLIETVQSLENVTLGGVDVIANAGGGTDLVTNSIRLTFNHPTKFITWVARHRATANGATYNNDIIIDQFNGFDSRSTAALNRIETGYTEGLIKTSQLKLNGQDRFATRAGEYFNYVQSYQHFSGCPDSGINVYSFAVKPEEHQPSGTCNFSRIDNANLEVTTFEGQRISIYALSYNVLRVASGMGGLAYSN